MSKIKGRKNYSEKLNFEIFENMLLMDSNEDMRYYLLDSNGTVLVGEKHRLGMFRFLVDIGVINIKRINEFGLRIGIDVVSAILDGGITLGRFKVFSIDSKNPNDTIESQLALETEILYAEMSKRADI